MVSSRSQYIAEKAEAYLGASGLADISYWGPELEHFVFDSAWFDQNAHSGYYFLYSDEGIWLSVIGKRFVAGLIRHAPEITLVTNQWVNSYKRLVPGFEALVYISWAHLNRADLVRVPAYKPGYESST